MSDRRWWEANAPLLARMADATAYPTATRVGAAAGAATGRPSARSTPTPSACGASWTAWAP